MMQATVEQGVDEVLQKLREKGLSSLHQQFPETADTVLQRFGLLDFLMR